jgi:diguanylate cyclase (GGDEF)-like protein
LPVSQARRRSPSLAARVRSWQVWQLPRRLILTLAVVELAAATTATVAFVVADLTGAQLGRLALLLVLSLGFEESARNIARLRFRLVQTGYVDMTSVWFFAAVFALQQAYVLVLVVVVRVYLWVRQQRGTTPGYRQVYSIVALTLSCQAAAAVMGLIRDDAKVPSFPIAAAITAAGILVYTTVNRLFVYGAMCVARGKIDPKLLVGDWEDNGLELATLCLGGLTGLALLHQPALAALAILPTFALQRGALVKELELAAAQDAKTGLLNAIAWQHIAKRELSRAEREHKPTTILIIDLDFFKSVNDNFGHVLGDAALRGVGECLREELRGYDTVGRFGGEEFVAVLPDVDELEAALIAERLRQRIGGTEIAKFAAHSPQPERTAATDKTLSTSIGVACYPEHGIELEQLLVAADSALYRAKRTGRNRVEFANNGASGSGNPQTVPQP